MKFSIWSTLIVPLVTYSHSQQYFEILQQIKSEAVSRLHNIALEEKCASDLKTVISDAADMKLWAMKMLDSSGKLYPGFLATNLNLLGWFDQCLAIRENVNGSTIEGQYCTVTLTITRKSSSAMNALLDQIQGAKNEKNEDIAGNVTVRWGLCLPKSCSVQNLQTVAQDFTKSDSPISAYFQENLCHYKNKPIQFIALDIFIYCFFMLVIVLIIGSTFYDYYLRKTGQDSNIFVIFSAYTNWERLIALPPRDQNILTCLEGIKVISCLWIMIDRTSVNSTYMAKNILYASSEWRHNILNSFIWNGYFAYDSLFTVSGLLLTFIYFKHTEKFTVNLTTFYLDRFIRLIPVLVATTFVHTSVLKIIAAGPYGPSSVEACTGSCSGNWWLVFCFFFISNKCALHAWFITTETQLYAFAPFILFYIKKSRRRVIYGMILIFLACVVYSFVFTIVKRLQYTSFEWDNNFETYDSILSRIPSWLIGVFFGLLLYYRKIKISEKVNIILWMVSLFTMLYLVLCQSALIGNKYSVYRMALWNSWVRPAWSLSLCFIICSCATGNGGLINDFLSNLLFRIFGKLFYSIYLVHYSVILVYFMNKKDTFYFGTFQIFTMFITATAITLAYSILLYLAFEAPILSLKEQLPKNRKI